jgi:hypothetical protein
MANRVYFTVYVSGALARQIEAAARARGWSTSRLLREAARAYLGDSPVGVDRPQTYDGPSVASVDPEEDPEDALESLAVRA